MIFVGIIEENQDTVHEITQYFLRREDYSLLFVCSSMEEYRSLPPRKKNRAGIIVSNSGQNNFDRLWQIKFLKEQHREARILSLTDSRVDEEMSDKLKRAGADSFIYKDAITKDLASFFGNEMADETVMYINPARIEPVPSAPAHKKPGLTSREFEIIDLVAKGYTNKKIGETLYISTYTVNAHMRKIFVKLSVNSRMALINHIINNLVQ